MSRPWFSTRLAAIALAAALLPACGDDDAIVGDTPDAGETQQQPDAGNVTPTAVLKHPSKSGTVAITEDDKFVVMVNPDNDTISIFQTSDNSRTAVVPVGKDPQSVVLHPDSKTAFVANRGAATVVKVTGIDTANPQVSTPLGTGSEPAGLALSPTGATLFVAELAEGSVLMVDTATMTAKGSPIKGNIQHPRSVAVTNDGDADDNDELLLVPEFYGEPNEFANDAATLDRSRGGRVRIYDLAQSPPTAVTPITFTARLSEVTPANGTTEVFVSPNQLYNIAIRRDATNPADLSKARIYVPGIGAAPQPPARFDGNVYSMVYVGDLGARTEITSAAGTVNLFAKIFAADGPAAGDDKNSISAGKFMMGEVVDLAFIPATGDGNKPTEGAVAYAVSRAGDAVQRITFGASDVTIGSSTNLQIDVIGGALHQGCKAPTGIVIDGSGGKAYVNCWASQTLGVVELGNQQKLIDSKEAFAPVAANAAVDRGRRFFFTGRARWSGNGTGTVTPTINNLGVSSCGACHPDGLSDNMTWIFNAGPRQSTSLDGTFSKSDGKQRMLNWTAIFEEIHDFDRNTRDVAGGLGAITTGNPTKDDCGGDFSKEVRQTIIATDGMQVPVKERQDTTVNNCVTDWNDIEAWIRTVRPPKGLVRLDAAKISAGRDLFLAGSGVKNGACANCHGGSGWTLSRVYYTPTATKTAQLANAPFDPSSPWPSVWNKQSAHIQVEKLPNDVNVGPLHASCTIRNLVGGGSPSTFGPAALEKKNPDLSVAQGAGGYNIPSLYGLSLGAPYLHSGQAQTLRELFDNFDGHLKAGNDNFSPSSDDKDALVAYLLSIDGETPEVQATGGFDKCVDVP